VRARRRDRSADARLRRRYPIEAAKPTRERPALGAMDCSQLQKIKSLTLRDINAFNDL